MKKILKTIFLEKIRLTVYFWVLLLLYSIAALTLPTQSFSSGALALFSVNSFLYGFYIAPILGSQKTRVEELHKTVRNEANAMFAMALSLKTLPKELRNKLQEMLTEYLKVVVKEKKPSGGEAEYEELITYCISYKGEHKEEVLKLLDKLVANQQNRTTFSMQMHSPVYANEWSIMLVLFGITIGFVLMVDTGDKVFFRYLAALLCTGLSMLVIILVKLSTLTHKRAKRVWNPYKKLIDSHFYRIDTEL
jgi:hypothetical protein